MNTARVLDLSSASLVKAVRRSAHPLGGRSRRLRSPFGINRQCPLRVDWRRVPNGTHEFYRERAQITKRLIQEKGFNAVAIEADWPDAYRVNRYIRGQGNDAEAVDALAGFRRFPTWMWRNADVLNFVGWLREHNESVRSGGAPKVGFYGLDLYSLHASMAAVIEYLDKIDPEAADKGATSLRMLRPLRR